MTCIQRPFCMLFKTVCLDKGIGFQCNKEQSSCLTLVLIYQEDTGSDKIQGIFQNTIYQVDEYALGHC